MGSYAILNIPSTLRAGDTLSWTESISDYPASDGWTLAFDLSKYGQSLITITAGSSGADYAIAIAATTSKAWAAGTYVWQAYVYKTSGSPPDISEKHTIGSGHIEILPDITLATSTTDLRSVAKKNLDMLEASLTGNTSPEVLSYSIGGRSISRMSTEDRIKLRSYWLLEYQRELEAEGIAQGLDSPRRIGVRFRRL